MSEAKFSASDFRVGDVLTIEAEFVSDGPMMLILRSGGETLALPRALVGDVVKKVRQDFWFDDIVKVWSGITLLFEGVVIGIVPHAIWLDNGDQTKTFAVNDSAIVMMRSGLDKDPYGATRARRGDAIEWGPPHGRQIGRLIGFLHGKGTYAAPASGRIRRIDPYEIVRLADKTTGVTVSAQEGAADV